MSADGVAAAPIDSRVARLRVDRGTTDRGDADGTPLGQLAYDQPLDDGGLGLPAIAQHGIRGGRADRWFAAGALRRGQTGSCRWLAGDCCVFGRIDLWEAPGRPAALETAATEAYRQLFTVLREHDGPRLLRIWNYVPHINADQAGLERYRRFNVGRQQAFVQAGEDAFEQSPAACAVGRGDGPLSVCFLAAHTPMRRLENPRQVSAYRYSPHYGPASPSFSRATLADAGAGTLALLVSGTASIVGQDSRHPGDVARQAVETVANLQAVLEAAHACGSARFELRAMDLTVYVRDPFDWPAIQAQLARMLGPDAPALAQAIVVQADICRRELLVEIEAHAVRPGGLT